MKKRMKMAIATPTTGELLDPARRWSVRGRTGDIVECGEGGMLKGGCGGGEPGDYFMGALPNIYTYGGGRSLPCVQGRKSYARCCG